MIKFKGLTKAYYKGKTILRLANFEAKPGQMTLLYGRSGVGKSTLLDIIAGLRSFQEGRYMWKHHNFSQASDEEMSQFRRDSVGYIPQDFALIADYTVFENLILPSLYNPKYNRSVIENYILDLSKRLGITDILDKKTRDISGGQKQRVAIARALVGEKEILLADEPTANLDKDNFAIVLELLQEQKLLGRTVIVSTHDDRLREVADAIYTIENYELHREEV